MHQQSHDPVELLKKQLNADCNQAQLADKIGISPQYLSEILRGKPPGGAVLDYLGLERVITYQPKVTDSAEPATRKRGRRRA